MWSKLINISIFAAEIIAPGVIIIADIYLHLSWLPNALNTAACVDSHWGKQWRPKAKSSQQHPQGRRVKEWQGWTSHAQWGQSHVASGKKLPGLGSPISQTGCLLLTKTLQDPGPQLGWFETSHGESPRVGLSTQTIEQPYLWEARHSHSLWSGRPCSGHQEVRLHTAVWCPWT